MDIDDLLDMLAHSEKELTQLEGIAYDLKQDEILLIKKILVVKSAEFQPGPAPPTKQDNLIAYKSLRKQVELLLAVIEEKNQLVTTE